MLSIQRLKLKDITCSIMTYGKILMLWIAQAVKMIAVMHSRTNVD